MYSLIGFRLAAQIPEMAEIQKSLFVEENITQRIYLLRDRKVMLDRDLAILYGVKPIRLREQVKRNHGRFPEHFMFQLTDNEVAEMVSQNAIPSLQHLGGTLPYAFTEHGILMLASVLKSETAMQISIRIIEIFIKMRELFTNQKDILLKLDQLDRKVVNHDADIQTVFKILNQMLKEPESPPRRRIGFRRAMDDD